MDIEEETPQRLVIADPRRTAAATVILTIAALWLLVVTPLATAQNGVLTGAVAAATTVLPLVWGLLILRRSRATFDAGPRVVEIRRSLFSNARGWTVPFDEIEELYVHQSSDPEGGRPGFQPFMATSAGENVPRAEKPRRWPGRKSRPRDG